MSRVGCRYIAKNFQRERGRTAERAGVPRGRRPFSSGIGDGYQYMPPMSGAAGAGAGGSGLSATRDSVVSTMEATEAAFSRAERVTLAGSTIPAETMSQYSSL